MEFKAHLDSDGIRHEAYGPAILYVTEDSLTFQILLCQPEVRGSQARTVKSGASFHRANGVKR